MATGQVSSVITEAIPAEPTLKLHMPQPPNSKMCGPSNKIRNRLRLDPSRALEPTRKKISTIEAQRVMSVFEDTISKAEIVTILPYILENRERFRVSLGAELSLLLDIHKNTVDSYEEIKQQLDIQLRQRRIRTASTEKSEGLEEERTGEFGAAGVTPTESPMPEAEVRDISRRSSVASGRSARSVQSVESYDSQTERTMRSLSLVAQQLSSSCKNILRAFLSNPNALNMIKAQARRSEQCDVFIKDMNDLRDVLLNKLLTTPEEEKERMQYIQEVSKRERQNAVVIEDLEQKLKAAMDEKDEEIKKKNSVIRKLQADLRQIEKFSDENNKRVTNEAEKQEQADLKNSEGKKQRLMTELNQLKTQLQNAVMEHRENEQELRRKKFRVESQVENWIQKYDTDMNERQNEYEEIDLVYTEEKKQLHELEERFKTLEAEYQQIMEERRVAREKREAAEREMALMVKAATTIQAFWRSFKVRKALKARKKKGGGKKKK
ncbi:dynein regulatory complex protein 10-like [Saccostrea echinata]|uniref:dynein regulatory complex protein 10-like n=1 Tax=Saccostrea echinata TaxID=191078 RepID=UPI002A8261E7|nr:dynein regulatory complex protein 10-like [Saccostrea echinata]